MHYQTVIRCYLEIKVGGHYSDDVCELLFDEFCESKDLSSQESKLLIDALTKWQNGSAECKSEQIKLIEGILSQKQGFMLEFARFGAHRLGGGPRKDF